MHSPNEYFVNLFALSFGFWVIVGLCTCLSIQRFIVKRYEVESDLLNTIVFQEHATFTRYLPDFFSSALYAAHLLICVWAWRLYKNKKAFRDIDDPSYVTQHFSEKEIRKVKRVALIGVIVVIHGIAYYIFRFIWPEVFSR